MLINQDYIKVYDNALSKELCEDIIQKFETHKFEQIVNDTTKFQQLNISSVSELKETNDIIVGTMNNLFEQYQKDCKLLNFQIPEKLGYESIIIKKYYDTTNDCAPSVDAIDIHSSNRYLAFLFYLNETDGGETIFINDKEFGLEIKPLEGRVIMFPPTWNYPYLSKPVNSRIKYIISSYINFV